MLFLPLLCLQWFIAIHALFVCFLSGKYVTHVVIVKDAVIGSPPPGMLHGLLTNQIAIRLLVM